MHTDSWDRVSRGVGRLTRVFLRRTQTDPNEPAQGIRQPWLLPLVHVLRNIQESLWAGFTHQLVKFIRDDFTHSERERERERSKITVWG